MYAVCLLLLFVQDKNTPLMAASFEGHVDVVRSLIEAQVDIHSQDQVLCMHWPNSPQTVMAVYSCGFMHTGRLDSTSFLITRRTC